MKTTHYLIGMLALVGVAFAANNYCIVLGSGTVCLNGGYINSSLGTYYFANNNTSGGGSDGNNYTSATSFSGNVLTTARTGMSSLTATIPNDAITLACQNITGAASNLCTITPGSGSGVTFTNGTGINITGNSTDATIGIINLEACNPVTEYSVWNGSHWSCDNDGGGGGGTVTSVTAGDGLTASPNPIVGAGTISTNALTSGTGNYSYWNGTAWLTAQDQNSGGTVTSVGINVNSSAVINVTAAITTSGNITISIPDASAIQSGLATATQITSLNNKALAGNCVGDNGTHVNVTMNATTAGVQCVEVLKISSGGNASWNESYADTLYWNSDGDTNLTGNYIINYTGSTNVFQIINNGTGTSNIALDVLQYNSNDTAVGVRGNTTSRSILKVSHEQPSSSDTNAAALGLFLVGTTTDAQGLYMDVGNSTGNWIHITDTVNSYFVIGQATGGADVIITSNSSNALVVQNTAGTDRFRIDSNAGLGYLGVVLRPNSANTQGIGQSTVPFQTGFINYITSTQTNATTFYQNGVQVAGLGSCSGDNSTHVNVTMNTSAIGVQCVEVLKSSNDGNNYTTTLAFTGNLLTLGRNGMVDLTAALLNNTILLDWANITNKPVLTTVNVTDYGITTPNTIRLNLSNGTNFNATIGSNSIVLAGENITSGTIPDTRISSTFNNQSANFTCGAGQGLQSIAFNFDGTQNATGCFTPAGSGTVTAINVTNGSKIINYTTVAPVNITAGSNVAVALGDDGGFVISSTASGTGGGNITGDLGSANEVVVVSNSTHVTSKQGVFFEGFNMTTATQQDTTGASTFVNVSNLTLTFDADSIYLMECLLMVNTGATTTGFQFRFNFTNALAVHRWTSTYYSSATAEAICQGTSTTSNSCSATAGSGGTVSPTRINSFVQTGGSSSDTTWEIATEVNASAATLREGSWCRKTKYE